MMRTHSLTRWSLLLAGILGVLLVAPLTFAQQPAEQPSTQPAAPPAPSQPSATAPATPMPIMQPQPTTVPGRPDIPNAEVATQLRGVPPPPFPTPEDKLPLPQLRLPKGFKIEVYVSGIANARSLRLGDKGTVFVSNRLLDKVYAVVEKNGKREAKSHRLWPGPAEWSRLSTMVRSTSPKAHGLPSLKKSRTISTTHRSPSSFTAIFSTISHTAGNL